MMGSDLKLIPFGACLKFWFFKLFLAQIVFQKEAEERLLATCLSLPAFTCAREGLHDTGEQLNHTEINPNTIDEVGTCVTPLLTCFPSFILELLQCCHLADFFPTSAAFYTLSFDLDNQAISEWNKSLHLTMEEHYRFRLELFLQQPEICIFPKFLSVIQKRSQHQCENNAIKTPFFWGRWGEGR